METVKRVLYGQVSLPGKHRSRLRRAIGIRGKMIHFGEGRGPESVRDQTKAGKRQ